MHNAFEANIFPPQRRPTRAVRVGEVSIGGEAPVSVQTMTKTDTTDAEATLRQVRAAAAAGAQIVRIAIPSQQALDGFAQIVAGSPVPIVADIHFDYRLAVAAIERGAHKIRINPGGRSWMQPARRVFRYAWASTPARSKKIFSRNMVIQPPTHCATVPCVASCAPRHWDSPPSLSLSNPPVCPLPLKRIASSPASPTFRHRRHSAGFPN